MTSIAFIGLGIMGSPMAGLLAASGHQVAGFNRSPGPYAALQEAGGRPAESVAVAVEGADITCLMLPDSPDVASVLREDGGVFDGAKKGSLIIDFSTIHPDIAADLAGQAREHGLRMVDAPVSGGQTGAINGELSIMVGGQARDVEEAKEIFRALGQTIVHVGPCGAGQSVKAANQLIVAANIQALCEAVVFLEARGVDLPLALDALGGGLAGSKVLEAKRANVVDRSFDPGFRIDLHHKDMSIFTSAAHEAGVVTPLGALVTQMMAAARAAGDGHLDHSALLRGLDRMSGRMERSQDAAGEDKK
ncbi:MAG: 2-hydroxy-3-oxopropionate reductase [Ornithinimicrobium sp.]